MKTKKPPTKQEYAEWRRKWILQEYDGGRTLRDIAADLGVSHMTVANEYQKAF